MQTNVGSIFLGVTPKPFRQYLKAVFEQALGKYDRLVIPCAGSFTAATAAIAAGWKPEQIECSDVSLYSSVIGYLASGKKVASLKVDVDSDLLRGIGIDGRLQNGADILYALKVLASKANNPYTRSLRDDLLYSHEAYREDVSGQLKAAVESLKGIKYEARDMLAVIRETIPDERALLYVNPHGSKMGYVNMFNTNGLLTWAEPEYELFDPKTGRDEIRDMLMGAPCLALIYRFKELEEGDAGLAVFGFDYGKDRYDFILSNRPDEIDDLLAKCVRPVKTTPIERAPFPLFTDDDRITKDSVIRFVPISKNVALYYRDLFAHRLGSTRSELYLAMLIDGKMTSVSGFHLSYWIRKGEPYAFETFGFSVRPLLYPRINKLHMMCLTCGDMVNVIRQRYPAVTTPLTRFKTVCLTRGHEQKGNRGVLKLTQREQLPNGMYRLMYEIDFREWGFEGALHRWMEKEGYDGTE